MPSFKSSDFSFFQPNIWDLLGVAVGAFGLYLSGSFIVSVSLSAIHVVEFVSVILLFIISAAIFFRYRESSAYPFIVQRIKSTICFSVDSTSRVPIGHMSREFHLNLRRHSPERFNRFIWLTDPSQIKIADLQGRLCLKAKIATGRNHEMEYPTEPEIKLHEFRKVDLIYTLPDAVKQHRRFRLSETYQLPNSFAADDEYYDVTIHEHVKKRIVRLEFEKIKLVSATFVILRGTRAPIYHEADMTRDEARDITIVQREFEKLRVGDVLSIRWKWDFRNS